MGDSALPTREEIAKLPEWAVRMFAVRCALYALLAVRAKCPDAPVAFLGNVTSAALTAGPPPWWVVRHSTFVEYVRRNLLLAAGAISTWLSRAAATHWDSEAADKLALAVKCAVTVLTVEPTLSSDNRVELEAAIEAAVSAAYACAGPGTEAAQAVAKELRTEFDIFARGGVAPWTESTPVGRTSTFGGSEVSPDTALVGAGLALTALPNSESPEGIFETIAKARVKLAADWQAQNELASSPPYRYDAYCRAQTVSLWALMAGGLSAALGMALAGTAVSIALGIVAYVAAALILDSLLRRAAS